MLDYRIETFLTLCKERSYSKAAKKLCITQPAITQHIQYLERYYNTKLFEYTNKQVVLTDQGKILERYAMGMNFTTKQVHDFISQSHGAPLKLHIGASQFLGDLLMPTVIEKVMDLDPSLHLVFNSLNTSDLIDGLKNGSFSCIFIDGPFRKDKFEYRLIATDEIIPVSAVPMENVDYNTLMEQTLIYRESGSGLRKSTDDLFYHHGLTIEGFNRNVQVNNIHVMKHLIKANTGIGFIYKSYVVKELEEGTLHQIPIDVTGTQEYNFVALKDCLFLDLYLNLYSLVMKYVDDFIKVT